MDGGVGMTDEQWAKVLQCAHDLSGGAAPSETAFLLVIKDITVPADEAAIDAELAAVAEQRKQDEIAALEARLAELKAT